METEEPVLTTAPSPTSAASTLRACGALMPIPDATSEDVEGPPFARKARISSLCPGSLADCSVKALLPSSPKPPFDANGSGRRNVSLVPNGTLYVLTHECPASMRDELTQTGAPHLPLHGCRPAGRPRRRVVGPRGEWHISWSTRRAPALCLGRGESGGSNERVRGMMLPTGILGREGTACDPTASTGPPS